MFLKQIFYFQFSILITIRAFLDTDLIEKFFEEKQVKFANIFGCLPKNEQVAMSRYFMTNFKYKILIANVNMSATDVITALKTNHEHIGVVLDGDCPEIQNFLITCGKNKFFDVKHYWLIISTQDDIFRKLQLALINIDADILIAQPDIITANDQQNWTITDTYNPASNLGGQLNATRFGYYNDEQGLHARRIKSKYWDRKNMTGVRFRTMVVLPVDFEGTLLDYLNSDADRDINTFNRFHSKLVHFCRDYYNFTMDINVTKSWGYTLPDGSFDGMVGALNHTEIDFGSSPLFVRVDRSKVIDYGRNTWILRAAFIFRNPKQKASIEVFLKPLATSIWLITGVFAILSIIILKIVTTFERKKYNFHVETSWSISVLFTLGAFCQQGAPTTPYMTCGRVTAMTILLLSVIIYQFYSASIVSNLLMKPANLIKELADLLTNPIKAGCEDTLYNRDFFKHSADTLIQDIYNRKLNGKRNNSNFLPPKQGLKLVAKGDYAFHVEVATAYPIIEFTYPDQAICELREVQLFRTQPMHANYQKHSAFRDMLDVCFQRIAEHGILFRERKHWHPRKPECINAATTSTFNVGLDQFYPALVILAIGMMFSLIFLIGEIQLRNRELRMEKKRAVSRQDKGAKLFILPYVD